MKKQLTEEQKINREALIITMGKMSGHIAIFIIVITLVLIQKCSS